MTIETLFSENQNLRIENESLKIQNFLAEEKMRAYESEKARLEEILLQMKRLVFGSKKERFETQEQGLLVFNEVEVESRKPEELLEVAAGEPVAEITPAALGTVPTGVKKRGHRKALSEYLKREIQIIELPMEERVSEDGLVLIAIGKECSEKLIYTPSELKVLEIHRIKYGVSSGDYEKTAPAEPAIIPQGIVTPSLLAAIVVKKYADGLPLYRQEEIFERMDCPISRSSMARWVVQAAKSCLPLFNILSDRLSECSYVSCDETRVQVLKEKGRKAESKSWMWVMCTPGEEKKIVLFNYDPSRSGKVVERLFEGYKGTLQVDGYQSYNVLKEENGVSRIGCNMHGRRYFEEAFSFGSKTGKTLSEAALMFYQDLYKIEEKCRTLSAEERKAVRDQEAVPIWTAFNAWAEKHVGVVPESSKIGKAFQYFKNQNKELMGYLKDGRFEMDNGFAERAIRKFAIGRNNWMFSDTEDGAEASALFYSLIVTAKVNGVNPYTMLNTIFTEIPKAKTLEDIEHLVDLIVTRPLAQ